jgi:hypothetical protein
LSQRSSPSAARDLGQGLLLHQRHQPVGQRPFGVVGKALDQEMGHDQAQDAVAQKLQALIAAPPRLRPLLAGAPAHDAGMGQRLVEQPLVLKSVAERRLDLAAAAFGKGSGHAGRRSSG